MPVELPDLWDPITGDPIRPPSNIGGSQPGGGGGFAQFGFGGPAGSRYSMGGPTDPTMLRRRLMGMGFGGQPGASYSVNGGGMLPAPVRGGASRMASPLFAGRGGPGSFPPGPGSFPTPAPAPATPAGHEFDTPGSFEDWWRQFQTGNADIGSNNRLVEMFITGSPLLYGTPLDPRGDPNALEAYRGEAQRNAESLAGRAALAAQAYGLDTAQTGYGAYQSMLNTQGGMSRALNEARDRAMQEASARRYALLAQLFGSNLQHGLNTQQGLIQQYNQPDQGFWDYVAGLGGQALGGWTGGGFKLPSSGRASTT